MSGRTKRKDRAENRNIVCIAVKTNVRVNRKLPHEYEQRKTSISDRVFGNIVYTEIRHKAAISEYRNEEVSLNIFNNIFSFILTILKHQRQERNSTRRTN